MSKDALETLEHALREAPPESHQRIDALVALSWELGMAQSDRSAELAREALALASELNHDRGRALALRNLAYLELARPNAEGSVEKARTALEIATLVCSSAERASVHDVLSLGHIDIGDADTALFHAGRALELAEAAGDQRVAAWAMHNMGLVHRQLGELEHARQHFNEAKGRFAALEHALGLGRVHGHLARLAAADGALADAKEALRQSIAAYTTAGHDLGLAYAVHEWARVAMAEGSLDEAQRHLDRALTLARKLNQTALIAVVEHAQGDLMLLEERPTPAVAQLERALASCRATKGGNEGAILESLARAHEACGALDRALACTREALSVTHARVQQETKSHAKNLRISTRVAAAEREAVVTERLLLNALPKAIVRELKLRGTVKPVVHLEASVLFTDFVGFTAMAEQLAPDELVTELDTMFTAFDEVTRRHRLEKLKTIGDAYMAATGIPEPNPHHAIDAVLAALEMRNLVRHWAAEREAEGRPAWGIRIGVHSGPLVAGIIGRDKIAYDIWGDTVNLAARMESSGQPDHVNISEATQRLVADFVKTTARGHIDAKNKGKVAMFFVDGLRDEYRADEKPSRALLTLLGR